MDRREALASLWVLPATMLRPSPPAQTAVIYVELDGRKLCNEITARLDDAVSRAIRA